MSETQGLVERRRQRFPVATVVLMAASVICVLIPTFTDLDEPYVGSSGGRMGAVFLLASVVLGLAGAVVAMFYRSIGLGARVGWAVVSAATGFIAVWATIFLLILFVGP